MDLKCYPVSPPIELRQRSYLLTASAKDDQILAAITHGAKGLMLKDKAAESLIDCIRQVAAGKRWLPAEIVDIALAREIGHQFESERLRPGFNVARAGDHGPRIGGALQQAIGASARPDGGNGEDLTFTTSMKSSACRTALRSPRWRSRTGIV